MTAKSKRSDGNVLQDLQHQESIASIERLRVLLQEAEREHHGRPAANWPRWYAAFVSERLGGANLEDAQASADRYILGRST